MTKPFRQGFRETVERLRKELRGPLMDSDRKTAFDHLLEAWGSELGAMSYAESFRLVDLLLMVSALDNRKIIEEIRHRLDAYEEELERITGGCTSS